MSGWKTWILSVLFLIPSSVVVASYPAAIWTHPELVTLIPDAENPLQVRIDGYFMVTQEAGKWGYGPVVQGWMLFECPKGKLAQCQMMWSEIAAKTGTCLGFGDMNEYPGTVHPPDQLEATPDLYPLALGVVPGFTPCMELDEGIAKLKSQEEQDAGPLPQEDAGVQDPEDVGSASDDGVSTDGGTAVDADGNPLPEPDGKSEDVDTEQLIEGTPDLGGQPGDEQSLPGDDTDVSTVDDPSLGDVGATSDTGGIAPVSGGGADGGTANDDKAGCGASNGPLNSPWMTVILLFLAVGWGLWTRKAGPKPRQLG